MSDPMKKLDLCGVTVATVLPFKDDLTIDWDGYARVLDPFAYLMKPFRLRVLERAIAAALAIL